MVKTRKSSNKASESEGPDDALLYGLYKQATKGDAPKRGFSFGKKNKTKKKAWKKLQNIPEETLEEALRHVTKALEILKVEKEGNENSSSEDSSVEDQNIEKKSPSSGTGSETAEDMSPEDMLLVAAGEDDVDGVRNLLKAGVSYAHCDECGQTALHMAADNGAERTLTFLLEKGAAIDTSDQHGVSVLQAAVIAGHVNICKILLERGADPEQADEDGDTPYTCAMDDGSPEMQDLFDDEDEEDDNFEQESTISWDTEFTMEQREQAHKIIDRIPSILDS
uniref:ACB domain-containing protein n=1 Tax=Entomoneis paludosa TaxID=265537 RepID=A0A7S2YFH4_9STRA